MTTYKIVRIFHNNGRRVIKKGLTLEEAQEHCQDPETSGRTCSNNPYPTTMWFDAYEEE